MIPTNNPEAIDVSDDTLRRLRRAVEWVERRSSQTDAIEGASPLYVDTVQVKNALNETIPEQAVVHVIGYYSLEPVFAAQKMDTSGRSMIGVAPNAIEPYGVGRVRVAGAARVTVYMRDGDVMAVGDRLGAYKDSWYAQLDMAGPLIIRYMYGDGVHDNPTPGTQDVMAEFIGRRADHVRCYDRSDGARVNVAMEVLYLRAPGAVTEESPGVVTLSLGS